MHQFTSEVTTHIRHAHTYSFVILRLARWVPSGRNNILLLFLRNEFDNEKKETRKYASLSCI